MKALFDFLFKGKHLFVGVILIWLFNSFYFHRMASHQLLFPDMWIFFAGLTSLYFFIGIFKAVGVAKKLILTVLFLANIYFYFYFGVGLGFESWFYYPNG